MKTLGNWLISLSVAHNGLSNEKGATLLIIMAVFALVLLWIMK